MTARSPLLFSPMRPEVRRDPYPHYRELRERDPVHWAPTGAWLLTRYADVAEGLRDPRFSADLRRWERYARVRSSPAVARVGEVRARWVLFVDAPDHTRLRTVLHRAFSPRHMEALRSRAEALADELLDDAAETVEFMSEFAHPLPFHLIAEALGVPPQERLAVANRCRDLRAALNPFESDVEDGARRVDEAATFLSALALEVAARVRREPMGAIVDVLVEALDAGELSEEEFAMNHALLLVAGHETTVGLLGNGLYTLAKHPEQMALLRSDPALLPGAVEEVLRFESPVQLAPRVVIENVQIGERTIRAGQLVLLGLGAGNRDPERFPDADRFDVTRAAAPHLALAGGPHYCLGAALGRLEARIAFAALLRRFEEFELTTDVDWDPSFWVRRPQSLKVTLR